MKNSGFFGNISNTIHMMKSCVNVLKKDKELVFFPIMAAIFIIILLAVTSSMGLLELVQSDNTAQENPPIFLLAVLIFGANFIIVFFNSALISAALERLRGGDPNITSGLSHAFKHVHHIFLWSIIVTIMALIFAAIRSSGRNRGMMGQMMTAIFASL